MGNLTGCLLYFHSVLILRPSYSRTRVVVFRHVPSLPVFLALYELVLSTTRSMHSTSYFTMHTMHSIFTHENTCAPYIIGVGVRASGAGQEKSLLESK